MPVAHAGQQPQLLPDAIALGARPRVDVSRLFVGRLRGGLLLEQRALAIVVVLGRRELGLGLADVGRHEPEVGRVNRREGVASSHVLAEPRVDANDSSGRLGVDVRDARVVEGDVSDRDERGRDVLLLDGRDDDVSLLDLRVRQANRPGPRIEAPRAGVACAEQEQREQAGEAFHDPGAVHGAGHCHRAATGPRTDASSARARARRRGRPTVC